MFAFVLIFLFIKSVVGRVRIDYYYDDDCTGYEGYDYFDSSCTESDYVMSDEYTYSSATAFSCDTIYWYYEEYCSYLETVASFDHTCRSIQYYLEYSDYDIFVNCTDIEDRHEDDYDGPDDGDIADGVDAFSDTQRNMALAGTAFVFAGFVCWPYAICFCSLGVFLCVITCFLGYQNGTMDLGSELCWLITVIAYSVVIILPIWGPPILFFLLFWLSGIFFTVVLLPISALIPILIILILPVLCCCCCVYYICCNPCVKVVKNFDIKDLELQNTDLSGGLLDGIDDGLSTLLAGGGLEPSGAGADGDEFAGTEFGDLDNYGKVMAMRNSRFLFKLTDRAHRVPLPSVRICPFCHSVNERNDQKCKHTTCRMCFMHFCHICLKVPTNYGSLLLDPNAQYTDPLRIDNYNSVRWPCGAPWAPCRPGGAGNSFGLHATQTRRNKANWSQKNKYNAWLVRMRKTPIPDSGEEDQYYRNSTNLAPTWETETPNNYVANQQQVHVSSSDDEDNFAM